MLEVFVFVRRGCKLSTMDKGGPRMDNDPKWRGRVTFVVFDPRKLMVHIVESVRLAVMKWLRLTVAAFPINRARSATTDNQYQTPPPPFVCNESRLGIQLVWSCQ